MTYASEKEKQKDLKKRLDKINKIKGPFEIRVVAKDPKSKRPSWLSVELDSTVKYNFNHNFNFNPYDDSNSEYEDIPQLTEKQKADWDVLKNEIESYNNAAKEPVSKAINPIILKNKNQKINFLKECLSQIRRLGKELNLSIPTRFTDSFAIEIDDKSYNGLPVSLSDNIEDGKGESLKQKYQFLVYIYNNVANAINCGDVDDEVQLTQLLDDCAGEYSNKKGVNIYAVMSAHRSESLQEPSTKTNKFYAFIAKYFLPKSMRFLEKYQFFDNCRENIAKYKNELGEAKPVERNFVALQVAVINRDEEQVQKLMKVPCGPESNTESKKLLNIAIEMLSIVVTTIGTNTSYAILKIVVEDYCKNHDLEAKQELQGKLEGIIATDKSGSEHPNKQNLEELIKIVEEQIQLDNQNNTSLSAGSS